MQGFAEVRTIHIWEKAACPVKFEDELKK